MYHTECALLQNIYFEQYKNEPFLKADLTHSNTILFFFQHPLTELENVSSFLEMFSTFFVL